MRENCECIECRSLFYSVNPNNHICPICSEADACIPWEWPSDEEIDRMAAYYADEQAHQ